MLLNIDELNYEQLDYSVNLFIKNTKFGFNVELPGRSLVDIMEEVNKKGWFIDAGIYLRNQRCTCLSNLIGRFADDLKGRKNVFLTRGQKVLGGYYSFKYTGEVKDWVSKEWVSFHYESSYAVVSNSKAFVRFMNVNEYIDIPDNLIGETI